MEWIKNKYYSKVENHLKNKVEEELKSMAVKQGIKTDNIPFKEVRKQLTLKVHPDKGGSNEEMQRLNEINDKLKKSLSHDEIDQYVEGKIKEGLHNTQNLLHNVFKVMKGADVLVSTVEFVYDPTQDNAKNVAFKALQFSSMFDPTGGMSFVSFTLNAGDKAWEGNHYGVLQTALDHLVYSPASSLMIKALATVNPMIATTLGVGMMGYGVYKSKDSLYSAYNKFYSIYYNIPELPSTDMIKNDRHYHKDDYKHHHNDSYHYGQHDYLYEKVVFGRGETILEQDVKPLQEDFVLPEFGYYS